MVDEILKLESSWERLQNTNLPIVLYGTGNGADKIVDRLESLSVPLYGVAASDGFVRSRQFRGFTVHPISYYEETVGDFILIVGFGSNRPELFEYVKKLAEKHRLLFPCVPVYGDEIFDRAFIEAHKAELEKVYRALADEQSKLVFRLFLRFQLCGNFEDLENAVTNRDEVFQNVLKLSGEESYLDLGAYRGDTVEEFLHYTENHYVSIFAVEPNAKTFLKLQAYLESKELKNCTALHAAISDKCGTLFFEGDGRHNTAALDGKTAVEAISVDALTPSTPFTYIKADVEGLELSMLKGAKETLQSQKPKLNLAAYHKSRDIFELPLFLLKLNPDYKLYLRKHEGFPFWDLNFYCI